MTRIGDAIAAARRERGWSRLALAKRCGYSHTQINDIENGRRMPRPATLLDIAEALSVPREDFAALWVVDKSNDAFDRMRAAGGWGDES